MCELKRLFISTLSSYNYKAECVIPSVIHHHSRIMDGITGSLLFTPLTTVF